VLGEVAAETWMGGGTYYLAVPALWLQTGWVAVRDVPSAKRRGTLYIPTLPQDLTYYLGRYLDAHDPARTGIREI